MELPGGEIKLVHAFGGVHWKPSGLPQNKCSVLDTDTAAAPLPPVSGPLPECYCTGCCERKPELNKALVDLGDQQCLFLPVNEASLAARNPR